MCRNGISKLVLLNFLIGLTLSTGRLYEPINNYSETYKITQIYEYINNNSKTYLNSSINNTFCNCSIVNNIEYSLCNTHIKCLKCSNSSFYDEYHQKIIFCKSYTKNEKYNSIINELVFGLTLVLFVSLIVISVISYKKGKPEIMYVIMPSIIFLLIGIILYSLEQISAVDVIFWFFILSNLCMCLLAVIFIIIIQICRKN